MPLDVIFFNNSSLLTKHNKKLGTMQIRKEKYIVGKKQTKLEVLFTKVNYYVNNMLIVVLQNYV